MKHFLISLIYVCTPLIIIGQSTDDLPDKERKTLKETIRSIEEKTTFKIYYKPEWIDSLYVEENFISQPVTTYLNQVLRGIDLTFSIYDGKIYVTKGRKIYTKLPRNFFGNGIPAVENDVPVIDYSPYEGKGKQTKKEESRLYVIGIESDNTPGNATISGTVRDFATGEPVIGATLYLAESPYGSATDQFGHYSLTLPKGHHQILIKSIGMKSTFRKISLRSSGNLNIRLEQDITPLKEVIVESQHESKVMTVNMGMEKLDIQTMKQIPLALGETDIIKVMLALPGVQSVGEGTSGLNVRGGASNQNLILLNDAVIFNPSHLFGFFSTFNPDVLRNVELYKSGISAEYGGRLSSVLDVHTRDGNNKKFSGSGGISPITGRLSFEGPIIKNKTSFIAGLRSTYSDWILRQLDSEALKRSSASFYDVTANLTHKAGKSDDFYLSAYLSKDRFQLNNDTAYSYQDRNAVAKWKHVFSPKLYSVATGSISNYNYTIASNREPLAGFTHDFQITQSNIKADFNYFLNAQHTFTTGASMIKYNLQPGILKPYNQESLIIHDEISAEQGREAALHFSDSYEPGKNWLVYVGARYSFYQYVGEKRVFQYSQPARATENIIDTIHYPTGAVIKTYHGIEPRISVRYSIDNSASFKASYNRMRQYLHMLSNTTAITPTDIWKLSDMYIKPQIGDQYSLGFYKTLKNNIIETSVETYYKNIRSTIDYKDHAVLLLNAHLETDVVDARGKAYGIEFMIKKLTGKANGWISYTYSRSFLQSLGSFNSEKINNGKWYPSNFDKPHATNFIGNYKFSRRFNFSLNIVYSTGRPITLPIAKYQTGNASRLLYSERNQFRIPDYFRSDISINIEGNHKIKKLAHSSWTLALYNVTGRQNAYSVFFTSENGRIESKKLSVFGRPIPTLTYNFKF